jgi:hypothetical protein
MAAAGWKYFSGRLVQSAPCQLVSPSSMGGYSMGGQTQRGAATAQVHMIMPNLWGTSLAPAGTVTSSRARDQTAIHSNSARCIVVPIPVYIKPSELLLYRRVCNLPCNTIRTSMV